LSFPGIVVDSDSKLLHSGGHNGGAGTNPSGGNQSGARQSQSNGLDVLLISFFFFYTGLAVSVFSTNPINSINYDGQGKDY
jgi:hypothetical protein